MTLFFVLTIHYFDMAEFWDKVKMFFLKHPLSLFMITFCYFCSFLLRAIAWRNYLNNQVRLRYCLQGVLLSLFINHITPIKLGDIVRIWILTTKERQVNWDEATHSVLIMRLLDILTLGLFSLLGLVFFSKAIILKLPIWIILSFIIFVLITIIFTRKILPSMVEKHWKLLKQGLFTSKILMILPLIVMSWVLEGSVVWGVLSSFDKDISFWKSIWINSITVGGQIFQITPGGITTYESIMSVTLVTIDVPMTDAYHVAFVSHAYKFLFSYGVGFMILLLAPKTKWKEIKEFLASKGGEQA